MIQPDLCNTGGITETKKICDMAQVYDMGVQIHVCGGPIATAAALHVETVIPNFTIHEEHNANLKSCFVKGGKYYYEDKDYLSFIDRMRVLVRDQLGKDSLFYIFTNDKVYLDGMGICVSDNSWYVDQFIMSRCDYIIGPPSTFSLWASYTGLTPFYHVKDKEKEFTLQDFELCHG